MGKPSERVSVVRFLRKKAKEYRALGESSPPRSLLTLQRARLKRESISRTRNRVARSDDS